MANLLTGKLGVVTGGGSGIGRAICERLAQQGARLVVVDLKKETAESTCFNLVKANGAHEAFACDVSKQSDVKGLVDFVKERFSSASPQIVVNCAGITQDSTLLKMSEEQFDKVVDVNLKGTFLSDAK
uniref:Estradiol 17-beta-dehydrogenase 8-like n=1 Tax=Steinernema glaseri TaxID=37863 RepID=A0A1I7Z2C7_9BILA